MLLSDTRVFLTVAVDLVMFGIQEPVRFSVETKARIYPANERFWYFTKKPHVEHFDVKLKEVLASYLYYFFESFFFLSPVL